MRPFTKRHIKGRGAATNQAPRFERLYFEPDPAAPSAKIDTVFYRDATRSILSRNSSPDVAFTYSINPYRGCEHGCIYCYARPGHEYLGLSGGLDFESKILVKTRAAELLAERLSTPSWRPQAVAMSGVTDPYQPIERRLKLTRSCLETFLRFKNPVRVISKNELITRDIDILAALANLNLVHVTISLTSLRDELIGLMEPRTSRPEARLRAIGKLTAAGIPVAVNVAPLIPGLTDDEVPEILKASAEAGAREAVYLTVRLPGSVLSLFDQWLRAHFPNRRGKVLSRLRSLHGGKLSDSRFGHRMRGKGPYATVIDQLFKSACAQFGLTGGMPELDMGRFDRSGGKQLRLI